MRIGIQRSGTANTRRIGVAWRGFHERGFHADIGHDDS